MSTLFVVLLVISSVALSVFVARLAVGEVFRLVRITRLDSPPVPDDLVSP